MALQSLPTWRGKAQTQASCLDLHLLGQLEQVHWSSEAMTTPRGLGRCLQSMPAPSHSLPSAPPGCTSLRGEGLLHQLTCQARASSSRL